MTTRNINALADAQALGWADARFTRLAANSVNLDGRMSFSGQSLTGSQADSLLGLETTWNTTGTPTAIDFNVTDTASNAASKLLDLRVGGVSRVSVSKAGEITTSNAVIAASFRTAGTAVLHFTSGGVTAAALAATGWKVMSGGSFSWSSFAYNSTADLFLARDAANTLAQRNGANAQAFNIYNTFTDASNYERGFMRWSSDILQIGTEAGGTGVARQLRFNSAITIGTDNSVILNNGDLTNPHFRFSAGFLITRSIGGFNWSHNNTAFGTVDTGLQRTTIGVVGITNGSTGGGAIGMKERTAPAAPGADGAYIYAEDNGAGKTRLMVIFQSGAAQQIAIEP